MEKSSLNQDFPSNSNSRSKDREHSDKKDIKKVVKAKPIVRKKSIGKRIVENFLGDDVDNVFEYVVSDVLVPAAKDMFCDAINTGTQMMMYGGDQPRDSRSNKRGTGSYVSYSGYYNRNRNDRSEEKVRTKRRREIDDIILGTRWEAEEVLDNLIELVDNYGAASIADLYSLVDITSTYTDNKWGWYNLSTADVRKIRQGWVIELPRPVMLD